MIHIISKAIGITFLTFFGWKHKFNLEGLDDTNSIIIYPHTSVFDFLIIIWYFMTVPEKMPFMWTLMKPQVFDYFGPILTRLNCIKCPRNQDKASGFVKELITKFKNSHFKILISPKGTTERRNEWRKGFWALSTKLDANIVSYGLDYYKKELVYLGKYETKNYTSPEEYIDFMKQLFARVPQMHPEREESQQNNYKQIELLPFDPVVTSNNFMILACLLMTLCSGNLLAYLLVLIGSVFSFIYHHSKEKLLAKIEPIITGSVVVCLFILYGYLRKIRCDVIEILIMCFAANMYLLGVGRHKNQKRKITYLWYHSLFHLSIPVLLFKIILN